MGKKRGEKRKYFFLHGAFLLAFLSLSVGCTTTIKVEDKWQGNRHLLRAEELINKKDYEGALKEYDLVVRLFPNESPGDTALFHMGTVSVHPDNPQRNNKKALHYFQWLIRDFPQSAFKEKSRVWISIINELVRYEDRIDSLEERVGVLKNQLDAIKEINIGSEEKKREDLPKKGADEGNGH